MKRILLTGKNGQVGWELQRSLAGMGEVIALGRDELDLTRPETLREVIRHTRPDLIVNAAAYTAVDKAESEPQLAMAVNSVAPRVMAEEAVRLGAGLVHYSTDYVFDGTKPAAYTEDDIPNPCSVYGRSKLEGERGIRESGVQHLILRTSWVYGTRGNNFLLTMLRLAGEREELRIVHDQTGAPTWSRMIAAATVQILQGNPFEQANGVYHLTAAGQTSWFGFTQAIMETLRPQPTPRLIPITTAEYPTPAKRPCNSVLSNKKLYDTFGIVLPDWASSLRTCREGAAPV